MIPAGLALGSLVFVSSDPDSHSALGDIPQDCSAGFGMHIGKRVPGPWSCLPLCPPFSSEPGSHRPRPGTAASELPRHAVPTQAPRAGGGRDSLCSARTTTFSAAPISFSARHRYRPASSICRWAREEGCGVQERRTRGRGAAGDSQARKGVTGARPISPGGSSEPEPARPHHNGASIDIRRESSPFHAWDWGHGLTALTSKRQRWPPCDGAVGSLRPRQRGQHGNRSQGTIRGQQGTQLKSTDLGVRPTWG